MDTESIVQQAIASPHRFEPIRISNTESARVVVRHGVNDRKILPISLSRSSVRVRHGASARMTTVSMSSRAVNKLDPNLARRLAKNSRHMAVKECDESGGADSNNASASMDGTFAQEQRVAKRLQRLIKKYIKFRTYFVTLMIFNVIVFLGIFAALIKLDSDEVAVLEEIKEIRIKKLSADAVQNRICQESLVLKAFVVLPEISLILEQIQISEASLFQLRFLNSTGYETSKYSRVGNGPFHSVSTLEDKSGRDYWLDFVNRNISVSRLNYNIDGGIVDRNTLTIRFMSRINHTMLGHADKVMVANMNISNVFALYDFKSYWRDCFLLVIKHPKSRCHFVTLEDGGCVPDLSGTAAREEFDVIQSYARVIFIAAVIVGTLQMFFLMIQFTCECMIKRQYRKVRSAATRRRVEIRPSRDVCRKSPHPTSSAQQTASQLPAKGNSRYTEKS